MPRRKAQASAPHRAPVEQPATSQTTAPLSPHWAFVVQLREGTALTPADMRGRVEHIVSGQMSDFTSLHELHAFMRRVLTKGRKEPP